MGIKMDMNKAHERLEQRFINRVLRANGFLDHFNKLIMQCVSSIQFVVLLNDSSFPCFKPKMVI